MIIAKLMRNDTVAMKNVHADHKWLIVVARGNKWKNDIIWLVTMETRTYPPASNRSCCQGQQVIFHGYQRQRMTEIKNATNRQVNNDENRLTKEHHIDQNRSNEYTHASKLKDHNHINIWCWIKRKIDGLIKNGYIGSNSIISEVSQMNPIHL